MSVKGKSLDSKTLARQKYKRRRLLTFWRIIRYGAESFARNSWLSIAATAVMTITLLIIFTAFVTQNVLSDTVSDLQKKVDMSIYLKTETTDDQADEVIAELKKLESVTSVKYVSSAAARQQIVEENIDNPDVVAAIKEATNKNPATLRVTIDQIDDTSELQKFVNENKTLGKYINPDFEPSFAGERRNTIESIGRAVGFAQEVGIIASSIFVVISSLIIFNTIRMAIFNRREEIQMMKLIGANQSFIRGPFLVEAIIYGFIAAIIATGIGVFGLYKLSATLSSYQINVQPTIDLVTIYGALVLLCMVGAGAIIGVISSLLATRRYLKL